MVWVKNVGMKPCYVCGSCGFGYRDAKTALECEDFCRKNHSCSPAIVAKANYKP
ncbi:MAG: hypothetical protein AB1324_02700 [Candidatus Micrarchaeota archaeon]